eukprot:c18063_g1_i1.p1 GENE.c18063_g1_i1~~c18063_g1_i1.p1  ORF type:complete len:410 (+),score=127.66 c18063_g1_i1:23-1252(+)
MFPSFLRAADGPQTFTYQTITERLPKIVQTTIQNNEFSLQQTKFLNELAQEMKEGSKISPLRSKSWNKYLEQYITEEATWHTAPWWVVENYFYKRLLEISDPEHGHEDPYNGYDIFQKQKTLSLQTSVQSFTNIITPLINNESKIDEFIIKSLWGNKGDLSLSGGQVIETQTEKEDNNNKNNNENDNSNNRSYLSDSLLCNDLLDFSLWLQTQKDSNKYGLIVLDNCGIELLCDLVLVDSFLRLNLVNKFVIHSKSAPVFVSDAMEKDILETIDYLANKIQETKEIGNRLKEYISNGKIVIKSNPFYTTPLAFWELPEDLKKEYIDSSFVILKGDANYRRLLGDRHWDFDKSFQEITKYFPAPLLVLRTCKSEIVVGVSKENQKKAEEIYPKQEWLTKGVFGVIQFNKK